MIATLVPPVVEHTHAAEGGFSLGDFINDLLIMSPWLLIAFVIGGLIGPAVGRWFKRLFTK